MTPIEKDKIIALCEKWGLKELKLTKGLFLAEDGTGITVNLRGDNPVVGVTIAGQLHTEGHGNLKVEDYQREIEAIMKSNSKKSQSWGAEQERPGIIPVGDMEATHTKKLGTPDNIAPPAKVSDEPKPQTQGSKTADSHSVGATTFPQKLQKAKCKECGISFELTLDEARNIFEEYDGIYCQRCLTKEAKHEEKEVKNEKKEGDNKIMETQIKTCISCGLELSGARALECFQKAMPFLCDECEEKQKIKGDEKVDEKLPIKRTDAEIDNTIELAKAEKFLKGQGGSYKVSGKNRPDSAMVQKIANAADISCEILTAVQTKDYAHVVVRGHRDNKYVDAVVHHDYETEFQLQTMEIIKKNPKILDHYEGLIPVLKEDATIVFSDKNVDARYHLIHTLLTFKTFSLRDATTKAMQIVQSKLLNEDSRTQEEVASEQKERDIVEDIQKRRH